MPLQANMPAAWLNNGLLATTARPVQEKRGGYISTRVSDHPMVAAMRPALALSALLIFSVSAEPPRYVSLTYSVFALYIAYSVTLCLLAIRRRPLQAIQTWSHWVEVGWYTLLITLNSSTNNIFPFGFYFAILVASFRWGFASGLWVTLVSTFLSITLGSQSVIPGPPFALNHLLPQPVCLLMLGYMIARWGGSALTLSQRLAFLKEVTTLAKSRFGVERAVSSLAKHLQDFYDADACSLIQSEQSMARHPLFRKGRYGARAAVPTDPVAEELARILETLPPELVIISCGAPHWWKWWCPWAHSHVYDISKSECTSESQNVSDLLTTTRDGKAFVIVPVRYRRETVAHLYLAVKRRHAFGVADIDFLLQVSESIMPILENIRLVDQLASDAAEEERRRIARDLHDSVVQPYLGLQIGLATIHRKLSAEGAIDVRRDIEHLIELANVWVTDLRCYVSGLRNGTEVDRDLLLAVHRFATKFAKATGITAHIEAETDIRINGRLAADVFQMVAEGLSNIRRHTSARQATIGLACREGHLILRIENEGSDGWAPFTPRSITERAVTLGGYARVERREDEGTAVIVEIPM